MKCFYHSADLDGQCSAAIVKKARPECELIGINHGDPFPWSAVGLHEKVYMVDFSLPMPDMARLQQESSLVWIDHHKSAINDYYAARCDNTVPNMISGLLAIGEAACELCWKWFALAPMPRSVYWLGRYDVWDHTDPNVLPFQYGMRMYDTRPDNQEFWLPTLADERTAMIVMHGNLLLQYETQQNKKFAEAYAFECDLGGIRCIAVNRGFTNAKVFDSVYDPARHDAMLTFCYKDGLWKVSLYSDKPEVDCSVICKSYGGGGHKGAAGFLHSDIAALLGLKGVV